MTDRDQLRESAAALTPVRSALRSRRTVTRRELLLAAAVAFVVALLAATFQYYEL